MFDRFDSLVNDAVWIRNLGIDGKKRIKKLQRGIRYKP